MSGTVLRAGADVREGGMVPTRKTICSLVVRHLKDQKYLQEKIQRIKGECLRQREWHPGRPEGSMNKVAL